MLGFIAGVVTSAVMKGKGREKMEQKCVVDLEQNMETGTWVATSKDVLGLILMSESKEDIKEQATRAVPALLKLNKIERFGENPVIEYCEREVLVPAI
jgi:hypothetical protein